MPREVRSQKELQVPDIESIKSTEDVKQFLRQFTQGLKQNHISLRNDILTQLKDGASGWFDDGANFRITVVDGVITTIADSTAGGHS